MSRPPKVMAAIGALAGVLALSLTLGTACGDKAPAETAPASDPSLPPTSGAPVEDRVIVLVAAGLDADLLERWRGELPGLERLIPGRTVGRLAVDGPAAADHTAAQLATGAGGGAHGRLGGAWLDPASMTLVPALQVQAAPTIAPFWEVAAAAGVTTRALWVPGPLPSSPLPGLTVLPAAVAPMRPTGSLLLLSPGTTAPPGAELAASASLEGTGPWSAAVPLGGTDTWPIELSQPNPGAWRISAGGVQADVRAGELGPPVNFTLPPGAGGGAFQARLAAATVQGGGFALGLLSPGRVGAADSPVTSPPEYAEEWARFHGQVDTTGGVGGLLDALRAGLVPPDAFAHALQTESEARRAALVGELGRRDARLVVAWLPEAGVGAEAFLGMGDSGHPAWTTERAVRLGGAAKTAVVHLDATILAVREAMQPGDRLIVVSDRGMASVRTHVDLNAALVDAGLLALNEPSRRAPSPLLGAPVAWGRTVAYATGPGLVYLNRVGTQRDGSVPPARAARELARVSAVIAALKDGKKAVVAQILPGDQALPAAPAGVRPDLVVRFADGYGPAPTMMLGQVGPVAISPNRSLVTGGFDPSDGPSSAGFAVGTFGTPDADARLADVGPTVLGLLGVPAPASMTGHAWASTGGAAASP